MTTRPVLALCALLSLSAIAFGQNFMVRSYNTTSGGVINRGDFNNDGHPDVVFCAGQAVGVALSNSDGTLQTPKYTSSIPCSSLAIADFNHDGKLDVAVGAIGASTTDIFLGNGDGTFHLGQQLAIAAQDLVAGDFNNDGNMDLAVLPLTTSTNTLYIYPGAGNGTFGGAVTLHTTLQTLYKVRIGDFDKNGKTDLVVDGNTSGTSGVEVLYNNGSYSFSNQVVATSGAYLLNTGDINQDGATDLLVGQSTNCVPNPKSQTCNWYFWTMLSNGPARSFRTTFVGTVATNRSYGITDATVADVNGDGINDVVGTLVDANGVYAVGVWKGHANGSFDTTGTYYELGGSVSTVAIVELDANRDGRPDFAVANVGDFRVGLTMLLNAIPRAACATYTGQSGVTGCSPTSYTYVPPSVHFLANGYDTSHPVTTMQVYVDGKLDYQASSSHIDKYLTLATGFHNVTFKEWDSAGASYVSPHYINVYSGTPGAVCSTALNTARICIPASTSSSSPVHVFAAGYPPNTPTSAQLYVDGTLKVNASPLQNYISTSLSLAAGSHNLVFKVWDANGHVVQASKTVTVP